jgi:hypothetical protein
MVPLVKIVGLEGTVTAVQHGLGVALKKQCQRATCRAYIHRLPQAIQYQDVLVEHRTHKHPTGKKLANLRGPVNAAHGGFLCNAVNRNRLPMLPCVG